MVNFIVMVIVPLFELPMLAPLQSSLFSSPAAEWLESGGQTLSQASSCGGRERDKTIKFCMDTNVIILV